MNADYMNTDAVNACVDLVDRSGAASFELGFVRDGVPVEDAGWYATVTFRGARIITDERRSPSEAATAMAERLLRGATCRCQRPITITGAPGADPDSCRWQLLGQRWEPGCDVDPVTVDGHRGDLDAIRQAMQASRG